MSDIDDKWGYKTIAGGAVGGVFMRMEPDMVNHPPHYTKNPSGVECIDVVEHLPYCIGNAIKYLWRADLKGNPLEDLRKAEFYIRREIERRSK